MSLKEFNKIFGIKNDPQEEEVRFVNRINQTMFRAIRHNPHPDDYESLIRSICYKLGINPNDFIKVDKYADRINIADLGSLSKNDFRETLKIIVLLYETVSSNNTKELINRYVELALAAATIELGIRWKDGMFYRSGAKELDKKLINDNLDWLHICSDARTLFGTALEHFNKSITDDTARKDTITNSYSSIEALAQKVLNNKKTFENNLNDLMSFLDLPREYSNIFNGYKQIAHGFSSRHPGSIPSHIETEAFIYMTGLLMRLISEKYNK
ncbi:MAG: hypothetical protein PHN74_01145 [Candidatus Pacebacteria bacterium]|nr:hypothetical protein [Candidatus Paceibacterota bacterium]